MHRTAFVDDKLYAKEFTSGALVRKGNIRDFVVTPYVGRVLYSNTDTGKVSVQWPWGVEIETASELIIDTSGWYGAPVDTDQSYSTWESSRWTSSREVEKQDAKWRSNLSTTILRDFEVQTLPLYRAACELWHFGSSEMDAFNILSEKMGGEFGHDVVRRTVANLYEVGRKVAIYWKDSQRKYKVTQRERSSGKLICPRCKSHLKPRTYRHGQRISQCRTCGFSIHPEDLLDMQSNVADVDDEADPGRIAAQLKIVADRVEASTNPRRDLVAEALRDILENLG